MVTALRSLVIACICLAAATTGCMSSPPTGTALPADLPQAQGYGGFDWDTPIEKFAQLPLQLYEAEHLEPQGRHWGEPTLELAAYFLAGATAPYDGVGPAVVKYLFCVDASGISRFCGVLINYDSQEFGGSPFASSEETRHWHVIDSLGGLFGVPLSLEGGRKVSAEDPNLVPVSHTDRMRYVWGAFKHEGLTGKGKLGVVSAFDPLIGEGWVLYATPRLCATVADIQANVPLAYWFYYALFNRDRDPFAPFDADQFATAERGGRFPTEGLVSERALDRETAALGITRPKPARPFTRDDFRSATSYHNFTRRNLSSVPYWDGYNRGVVQRYFGTDLYSTPHYEKWMAANQSPVDLVRRMGEGYRDGLALDPHPPDPDFRCRDLFPNMGRDQRPPCHGARTDPANPVASAR
jgi:hypothetical protein